MDKEWLYARVARNYILRGALLCTTVLIDPQKDDLYYAYKLHCGQSVADSFKLSTHDILGKFFASCYGCMVKLRCA